MQKLEYWVGVSQRGAFDRNVSLFKTKYMAKEPGKKVIKVKIVLIALLLIFTTVSSAHALPNDPALQHQWYLYKAKVTDAWTVLPVSANRVKVGIIDTGLIANHQDIDYSHVIWGCDHTIGAGTCLKPVDVGTPWSHGTGVAGIIAARQNNGLAIAGISNSVDLIIERVCNAYGCPLYSVARGITHAADKGAKIINVSLTSKNYSAELANALTYAKGKGVLLVCASGNEGVYNIVTPIYPAILPECMTVGGTDEADHLATISNWGNNISVVAPGVHIFSLDNDSSTAILRWDGTSFSAAQVSGLAAMLYTKCGGLKAGRMRKMIEEGATPIGPTVTFGHGRIDAAKAMSQPCMERIRWNRPPVREDDRTWR